MSKTNRDPKTDEAIDTMADAVRVADELTITTGEVHTAVDHGRGVWPRFAVIEAPKAGDPVSMYFNGDSYPTGTVVSVSDSLHTVKTSTGHTYRRRGRSGVWRLPNGSPFQLIRGHHNERNPHF